MAGKKKKPRDDWFCPSHNFGALPPSLSGADTSTIVVLPVPYESTTTYGSGCHRGPNSIIEASANMELYDEELEFEPCKVGIHTSLPLNVLDDSEEMIERVNAVATAHLRKGRFVTVLGGEHTVSLGMVRAVRRMHSNLSVLFLDAHADFRQSYRGNKYSHACVGRRISELCHLVQAGVRSLSSEEARALKREKITTFWAAQFRNSRDTKEQGELVRNIVDSLKKNVYISIDVDVFDPAVMPAVGTPEPGGLLWDEILNLVRSVADARKIVGLDLVELSPVDGLTHPEFTAARLMYKVWGYAFKTE